MRKIISIVLTLGIILGLTAFAAPVAAAPCVCPAGSTPVPITDALGPPSFCAGGISNYVVGDALVSFVIPIVMLGNTDSYALKFPAGTDLSGVVPAGVTITSLFNGVAPATSITVVGTELFVKVPVAWVMTPANDVISLQVNGVKNPVTPDTYCLYTGYMDDCCTATYTDCGTFTVIPYYCELDFAFDFGATYVGIAPGFIPPFKACGQVGFGHLEAAGWVTDFDLTIDPVVPGCHPLCTTAKLFFVVTHVASGGVITFSDGINPTWTLTALDVGLEKVIDAALVLPDPCAAVGPLPMWLHFSTPGDYEICFYLECPAIPCGAGEAIIADECLPAKVYQWKEAEKIPLYRKWNLISLPLVPLEDPNAIEDVWAAYALEPELVSVHYYDQCADAWSVYGPGQTSLDTMEDGKSYWVKIAYDFATKLPGAPMDGLWVWGNQRPVPPDAPAAYPVCTGWNMVGFTGLVGMADFNYLWNWWDTLLTFADYGAVYGWDPTLQTWWSFLPGLGFFPWNYIGEGYWISFEHDGMIYPP